MPQASTQVPEGYVKAFFRPRSLSDAKYTYCPGCHHGIVGRLIAEAIDELGIQDRTVGIAPVGCAVFLYQFYRVDFVQAAHGRACAVATGIKRANPELVVFSYQGDGDLAAIGTAETVHAANRGENITVIFVNNQVYGMTGGEMAPTTLPGQRTTTTPEGRDVRLTGYPLRISEMLAQLDGPAYITRQSVHDVRHIQMARRAILKAFRNQLEGKGFSLVEIVAACPTNLKLPPPQANRWVAENALKYFPLGDLKVKGG
ncbi:MAG: 2-oxoglutarate ferredoxin oxidoreductase subunit beta [Acetothermia bacterium 64_32]|nr:MAG: 2-oxoglutarate ferredoxin oxidoreductase subunit beta [Acetothermia bacterium 64_32]MBC7098468.1 2-oxoglutarate oxidoreductase [Candidatus Bipolaricaulota bacterium]HAF70028.1 2-oxoglutarate oxidoreductase [Candidatus Acetothermia bacterium]